MEHIFNERATLALVMRIEAALAGAQATLGIIPANAARVIQEKARPELVPEGAIEEQRKRVGHPLVAILAAWSEVLGHDAASYLHYGTTTPDIRLTQHILQLRQVTILCIEKMRGIEQELLRLSVTYRATPMVGRTVGRHALPITFGLKTASWMAENRRNIERLQGWLSRTDTGVMSGAVGSYAALGDHGFEVESLAMRALGLGQPDAVDWKGTRDKHAEWGLLLSITAKSLARMAQEIFLLQGDDFQELDEANEEVGSSTMPHKSNPRRTTAVIALSRDVVNNSGVLLDWMVSIHERDQINNENVLQVISISMGKLLDNACALTERLIVYPQNMRRNMDRTNGLIMAERVMFKLGERMGKHLAHGLVREAALTAVRTGRPFRETLGSHPEIAAHMDIAEIDALLDPATYLGKAPEAVDRAVVWIKAARLSDEGRPRLREPSMIEEGEVVHG